MHKVYVLLSLVLLWFNPIDARAEPVAVLVKDGRLDLANYSFEKQGNVNLRGRWHFVWHNYVSADEFAKYSSKNSVKTVAVPDVWNSFEQNGKRVGGVGYGTYHLSIQLPAHAVNQPMALKMRDVGTAYRLFINGQEKFAAGQPGMSNQTTQPEYRPNVIYFTPQKREISLLIHCANFHYTKGGLWEEIILGRAGAINRLANKNLGYDLFLIGALIIMALYHFGLYLLRTKEKSTLLFGLFALILGVRSLLRSEMFIYTLWPDFPFVWHVRLEYICFYAALPIFYWFSKMVFFPYKGKIFGQGLSAITAVFLLSVIFTKPVFFTGYVIHFELVVVVAALFIIFIMVRAARADMDGAYSAIIGFGLFFLTIINDILRMNLVITTPELAPLGFFLFIFSQSFMLSQRFSRAFHNIEILTEDLSALNRANARFVPNSFLGFLNRKNITEVRLGDNVEKEMTILFSDMRNFTSLSEKMTPEENFEFINKYLHHIGPQIRECRGFIDKYIGDGVMALFPYDVNDAVEAAIRIQQAISGSNSPVEGGLASQTGESDSLRGDLERQIQAGIGLHKGLLRLGTIGEEERIDVTVISNAVNLASRLEGLTKLFQVPIIISQEVYQALDLSRYNVRRLGRVNLRGYSQEVPIYEILDGYDEKVKQGKLSTQEDFEQGVDQFLAKEYSSALESFRRVLEQNHHDDSARYYIQLIDNRFQSIG